MIYPISVNIDGRNEYTLGERIQIYFSINNESNQDFYFLENHGLLSSHTRISADELTIESDFLSVTHNAEFLPYDGVHAKFPPPTKDDYIFLKAHESITGSLDISSAYPISDEGFFQVEMRLGVSDLFFGEISDIEHRLETEESEEITVFSNVLDFTVQPGDTPRLTEAAHRRQEVGAIHLPELSFPFQKFIDYGRFQLSKKDKTKKCSKSQKSEIELAAFTAQRWAEHCSEVIYSGWFRDTEAAWGTWFGRWDNSRVLQVRQLFEKITKSFNQISYDCSCNSNIYAYTYVGVSTVWLCKEFWNSSVAGIDSQAGTIIHELSHALGSTSDHKYGYSECKKLARKSPEKAIQNADSIEYFTETQCGFNSGFDSVVSTPNGKTYATKLNLYVRYSDKAAKIVDAGYPKAIKDDWGLTPVFGRGIDSAFTAPDGKIYVTRGGDYARYSGNNFPKTVDAGYPKPIRGNLGKLPG